MLPDIICHFQRIPAGSIQFFKGNNQLQLELQASRPMCVMKVIFLIYPDMGRITLESNALN